MKKVVLDAYIVDIANVRNVKLLHCHQEKLKESIRQLEDRMTVTVSPQQGNNVAM